MADYTRYKTETLQKMRDKAYEKYVTETSKPCGNWGDGMRLTKLPALSTWEKARNKYNDICAEIERRENTEFVDKKALRDVLYEADAITMKGVSILNQFPSIFIPDEKEWDKNISPSIFYQDIRNRGLVPKISGEWIREEIYDEDEDWPIRNVHYLCSVCKKKNSSKMNYCPDCGACMKGENK